MAVTNTDLRKTSSWIETSTATNAVATATRAATTGVADQHYVTGVTGGFDATVSGAKLILKDGTTEVGRWNVYDTFALVFPHPIEISADASANLELDAGGSGIVGAVTMLGYTL